MAEPRKNQRRAVGLNFAWRCCSRVTVNNPFLPVWRPATPCAQPVADVAQCTRFHGACHVWRVQEKLMLEFWAEMLYNKRIHPSVRMSTCRAHGKRSAVFVPKFCAYKRIVVPAPAVWTHGTHCCGFVLPTSPAASHVRACPRVSVQPTADCMARPCGSPHL